MNEVSGYYALVSDEYIRLQRVFKEDSHGIKRLPVLKWTGSLLALLHGYLGVPRHRAKGGGAATHIPDYFM